MKEQKKITIRLYVNLQQDQRIHNLPTAEYYSMKSDQTRAQTQTLLELHQMLYHWAIRSSRVLQYDQIPHSVTEEIVVIIPEKGVYHIIDNRDIVLWTRGGQLQRISQNSPSYAALHYILLFPKGKNSWHTRLPIHGA